jgi:hypothetical protein
VTSEQLKRIAKCGVLLGIAGGLAEVIWIASYGSIAGGDAAGVARGVTAAVGWLLPGVLAAVPTLTGIAVHMVIAVGIGVGLMFLWRASTGQRPAWANEFVFMIAALTAIWAFNFFVVLPLVSPGFVELLPYPVSLASKVLFGLAGAAVLRSAGRDRFAASPVRMRTR